MIRKQLPAEPRILDAEKGIVEYVASNETIDSQGDKILVRGWRFGRMEKNGPFLNSHRKGSIYDVLGRVLGGRLDEDADGGFDLVEKVQWAVGVGNWEIDTAFRMTQAGFLKAVSVGFTPVVVISKYLDRARKKVNRQFEAMVSEFGVLPEESEKMNRLFVEQEQVELSAVSIGSNPDALLKSFEEGVLVEEDLAKLGFAEDSAFEFLTKMAEAMESPECTDAMELLIEREMSRTMEAEKPHAETRSSRDEEEAREAEREEFLKQLSDVTSDLPGVPSGGGDASRKAHDREEFLKALEM